jgi:hypothetical protein
VGASWSASGGGGVYSRIARNQDVFEIHSAPCCIFDRDWRLAYRIGVFNDSGRLDIVEPQIVVSDWHEKMRLARRSLTCREIIERTSSDVIRRTIHSDAVFGCEMDQVNALNFGAVVAERLRDLQHTFLGTFYQ